MISSSLSATPIIPPPNKPIIIISALINIHQILSHINNIHHSINIIIIKAHFTDGFSLSASCNSVR